MISGNNVKITVIKLNCQVIFKIKILMVPKQTFFSYTMYFGVKWKEDMFS